jgi:hypothetical protein
MRNSGWYIPYWRRSKKKGKAEQATGSAAGDVQRSDEQMEAVRQRWVERYRRTVRSLGLLGLSIGSTRTEVRERYERLREEGVVPARELEDAYRFLMRVMLAQERRKRRARRGETAETAGMAGAPAAATPESDDTDEPVDEEGDEADDDEEEQDEETEAEGLESASRADDAITG